MNLRNTTRNQHFVAQVEQRLNAINPMASEENQRIYAFTLKDRESYKINLQSIKGIKINSTLSITDLFSFEILKEEENRYNFENLFRKYESDIKTNTQSLLSKIKNSESDIKPEILNLFVSKFLNFVRNPFSIKKVLDTFSQLKDIQPIDPIQLDNFQRIINGRKPQQKHLCEKLGISEQEYINWLAIIFLLLTQMEENKSNILEQTVKKLYENPNTYIMVMIYRYDDKTCLLSDRGYSMPLPQNEHMAFDFNLCSNSFIRYVFGDINSLAPKNIPKEIIQTIKSREKSIHVLTFANDFNALAQYNKHVVYQCFNTVFNSSIQCHGL